MQTRLAICVMSLALATPAWAQQAPEPQRVAADPNQEAIKHQVTNFESILRNAVNSGASQLADETKRIVPSAILVWISNLDVNGWYSGADGYTFHVIVPGISPMSAILLEKLQTQMPAAPPLAAAPTTAVSRTSTAKPSAAATVSAPDTMVASPVAPFDPIGFLSDKVRAALIDALLDNTGALPIQPGQRVRIVAHPGGDGMPNPLGGESRKLMLSVSGDDLLLFRKGQLKREDLLAKIKEERF